LLKRYVIAGRGGIKTGILFLRLRLKDGAFSLVSATNVPGVLKTPRGTKPPKEFAWLSKRARASRLGSRKSLTRRWSDWNTRTRRNRRHPNQGGAPVRVEFTLRVRAASDNGRWRSIAAPRLLRTREKNGTVTGLW